MALPIAAAAWRTLALHSSIVVLLAGPATNGTVSAARAIPPNRMGPKGR